MPDNVDNITPNLSPAPFQPMPSTHLSAMATVALALITALTSIAGAWITANARANPAADSAVERRTGEIDALKGKIAGLESTTRQAESDLTASIIPKGTIIAWATKNGPIPQGWQICNGDNGTPNLVGKFLRGVGTLGEMGSDPDGRESHKHSLTTAPSESTVSFTTDRGNDSIAVIAHSHIHSGETTEASHIPPNYRVVYIIKI